MPHSDDSAYQIGYKKPPRQTQFKPGQSGNPHGRPKKVTTFDDEVDEELLTRITILEGGKRQKVTKRRAIAKQHVNKAVGGNASSTKIVLRRKENDRPGQDDNLALLLEEFREKNARHAAADRERNRGAGGEADSQRI